MKMKNVLGVGLMLILNLFLIGSSFAANDAVFDTIMQRVRVNEWEEITDIKKLNSTVAGLLNTINSDGSWSDLDYNSTVASNWPGTTHLNRVLDLSLAYTLKSSNYYNNSNVSQKIIASLNFFYTRDPQSTNWYVHQIGNPQRLGRILILMRGGTEKIPSTLENNILKRIKETGSDPLTRTGANKSDIAIHWVYRGCLTKDHQVLAHGVEQVFYPVFMTTQEGLQHDYAYFQHGQQLYTGGYGVAFVRNTLNLAVCTLGTEYELSNEKTNLLTTFFRDHYLNIIRGQTYMYNTVGRQIALSGGVGASYVAALALKFKKIDPGNAAVYDAAAARLSSTRSADYQIPTRHYHYWRGDYTLVNSPEYAFDVRMASNRICRNENGNGQNLKGYFLTEGAYSVVLDGSEYRNIFPVWDWAKIPGTTLPHMATIPNPGQWEKPGNAVFAGGVSNGNYGVTTYFMDNQEYNVNTEAKKSWFMFGEEIVCLGAGIKSMATVNVNTTVNQCMQNGGAYAKQTGSESYVSIGSTVSYSGTLEWVHHNKVAYYFPNGGNLNLSFAPQSGSWYSIATTESKTNLTSNVFKLWFNHGYRPTQARYEYIIVPNKTLTQARNYNVSDIVIAANGADLQAVYNKKLKLWGMVFYKATTFSNDDFSVSVDAPCVLMMENPGTSMIKGWLADPSQSLSTINVQYISKTSGNSETIINTMPKMPHAGSTVEFFIQNTSSTVEIKDDKVVQKNKLIPNPVVKGVPVSLIYNSLNNLPVNLSLLDMSGKVLMNATRETVSGKNVFPITTNMLTPGVYLVCTRNEEQDFKQNHLIVN
jgi:chondroitin AC lyase